jgi:hypothetical protein
MNKHLININHGVSNRFKQNLYMYKNYIFTDVYKLIEGLIYIICDKLNEKYISKGFEINVKSIGEPAESDPDYTLQVFTICIYQETQKTIPLEETNNEDLQCSICKDNKKNIAINCGHLFCLKCISELDNNTCPSCNEHIITKLPIYL